MGSGGLSAAQKEILDDLTARLAGITGVEAVVLGGSHARGYARPGSDLDVGLFYSEERPFAVEDVRGLAGRVNDEPNPTVSGFYEWGRWVNGGVWLTVRGQRVDFLYRNRQHVERTIEDAHRGRYELDYDQQPPFGFFSATYLGEVQHCIPLHDPQDHLGSLKRRVASYPEALRRAVVRDYLWSVEFGLDAFARKFAARGDVYGTAGCLARMVNQLVLVLFALNRVYPVNDKTALAEVFGFSLAPRGFATRVERLLSHPGRTPEELAASVETLAELYRETAALADGSL